MTSSWHTRVAATLMGLPLTACAMAHDTPSTSVVSDSSMADSSGTPDSTTDPVIPSDEDAGSWAPWDGAVGDSMPADGGTMDSGTGCLASDASCLPGIETFELEAMPDFGIVTTPYTYRSGLSLSAPVPNTAGRSPVVIVRCPDSGFFGFRCLDGSGHVPSGSSFIAAAEIGRHYDYVELTLPADASIVRFYVAATSDTSAPPAVHVTAIGADGTESSYAPATVPHFTSWTEGLVEVRREDGIRRLRISVEPHVPIAIDDIMWE